MNRQAEEFRTKAAECRQLAKSARTLWETRQLSDLAVLWDDLATGCEKIIEAQDKLEESRKATSGTG